MTTAVARWTAAPVASCRCGVWTHGHLGRVGEASAVLFGCILDTRPSGADVTVNFPG